MDVRSTRELAGGKYLVVVWSTRDIEGVKNLRSTWKLSCGSTLLLGRLPGSLQAEST